MPKYDLGLLAYILLTCLLLCNGFFSLHFVEKCYPDKVPGKGFRVGSVIITVLAIFLNLILVFIALYFLIIGVNATGIVSVVLLFFLTVSGIYICWQQIVLEKLIYRNHEQQLNSFLEEPTP